MRPPTATTMSFAAAGIALVAAGVGLTQIVPHSPPPPPPTTSSAMPPIQTEVFEPPYERSAFGPAWTDDQDAPLGHNGCDTRDDILARDMTDIVYAAGKHQCVVLSGTLVDPYSGGAIRFHRGQETSSQVQIDHIVPLADAWRTGAYALTPEKRRELANDPLELLAVDGPNNNAKSDKDISEWVPPNAAFHCEYATRYLHVKQKYGLWTTQAEHDALLSYLDTCTTTGS